MAAISFHTDDDYLIQGQLYPATGQVQGKIIVAGATGVPQGFYRRFAEFASEQGFTTLTFDYRGIGASKPASLKGFEMDLLDWGRRDLAAAVETMSGDDLPLFVIGHSYGGHAFGLLPNHRKVSGLYVFGTGAGWHGYMPFSEQLKVLTMWNTVLPLLTRWKGYCAWSLLGMGEDLPKAPLYNGGTGAVFVTISLTTRRCVASSVLTKASRLPLWRPMRWTIAGRCPHHATPS